MGGLLRFRRLSVGVLGLAGLSAQASDAQQMRSTRVVCSPQPLFLWQRAVGVDLVDELLG